MLCLGAALIKAEMMCVAKIFGVHRALIVSIVKIDVLKRQRVRLIVWTLKLKSRQFGAGRHDKKRRHVFTQGLET